MPPFARSLVFMAVVGWTAMSGRAEEASQPAADRAGIEFFERKVRPIFAKRCYEIGARCPTFPGNDSANWASGNNGFGLAYSTTTVRYPIGYKTEGTGGLGNTLMGTNTAIQSAHPDGAAVLRADGGVAFLSATTDPVVVRNLCIRDDGQLMPVEIP